MSTALIAGSLLTGCGAMNASNNGTHTPMQNVGYRTNQVNPNNTTPDNVNPNNTNPNMSANMNNNNTNNANNQPVVLDNRTANQIANDVNRIKGVKYATTLINGNTVYVGVTTTSQAPQNLNQQVRNTVQRYVGNRQVQLVTDKNMVQRMSNATTNMTNGNMPATMNANLKGIFNDLGKAVQRPFQNTAQ